MIGCLTTNLKAQSIEDDIFITDFELLYGNDQGSIHDMVAYGEQKVILSTTYGSSTVHIILLSKENFHLDSLSVRCAPANLSLKYDYAKQLFYFKPLFFYKSECCALDYERGQLIFGVENNHLFVVDCEKFGKGNQGQDRFYFQSHLVSFNEVERRRHSEQTVYIDNKEVINFKIEGEDEIEHIYAFAEFVDSNSLSILDIYHKELYKFDGSLEYKSFKNSALPAVADYRLASSQLFKFQNGYMVFYRFFTPEETGNRVQKLFYFDENQVIDLSDKLPKRDIFKVNIINQYLYVLVTHEIDDWRRNMMYKREIPLFLNN
ncbi:MAG: hypothetical protein ACI9XJ_000793 [Marivirga sp.]|jgi:hypothetical protein